MDECLAGHVTVGTYGLGKTRMERTCVVYSIRNEARVETYLYFYSFERGSFGRERGSGGSVEGWLLKKWCGCRTLGHSHPHLVERCVLIPGPVRDGFGVAFEAVPSSSNSPEVRATLPKRKVPKSVVGPRVESPKITTGRPGKIRGMSGQRRVSTGPVAHRVSNERAVPCHARLETVAGLEVHDPVVVGRVAVEAHVLDVGLGPSIEVVDVHVTVAVGGIRWDGAFDEGVVFPADVAVCVRQHPAAAVRSQIAVNLVACSGGPIRVYRVHARAVG